MLAIFIQFLCMCFTTVDEINKAFTRKSDLLSRMPNRNFNLGEFDIYIIVQWKMVLSRDVNFVEDGVRLIFTRSRVDRRYWAALSKIETPKDLSTISERLGWDILISLTLLKVKILCLPEER